MYFQKNTGNIKDVREMYPNARGFCVIFVLKIGQI